MIRVESIVFEYPRDVLEIRSSGAGAGETSYYPALERFPTRVGAILTPKIRCIISLKNEGSGLPDGGFFTPDQLSKREPQTGGLGAAVPARGVLEVKAASEDVSRTAGGEQVDRYYRRYRQVLVTNGWDWILVGSDDKGAKARLERFRLAGSEADFWVKLAIGYSPAYQTQNAAGPRLDWPRIPLPPEKKSLSRSASLGRLIGDLLDVDAGIPGLNDGALNPFLRLTGLPTAVPPGRKLDPARGHLELTAGWGHKGQNDAVMPGKGLLVEREYSPDELKVPALGARHFRLTKQKALTCIGQTTRDIYLNKTAFWRNVPKRVWEYYIGGYQVVKKWLSYREANLLGRSLTTAEARYVSQMVRRLTALRLLEFDLDDNYKRRAF